MKRKSTNYSTPDGGGWMHLADDSFLARYRGRPCAVCGSTHSVYNSRNTRASGHHLLSKELHRAHRYTPENIIVLCPTHHMGAEMSPHSHDGAAQKAFYDWLTTMHTDKAVFMDEHRFDKFNKEWCYREMYVELGGQIDSKTGNMKDYRAVNHAALIRKLEGAE